ncbi:hydroxyacid dehydrogenase [Terrarubrum flagellatum]|uniref:hydroxyacid dehydrogenase n=1 Tax=Terrirubrum flagellatum TaxID=2895980 RepID=UPI003144DD58
MIDCVITQPIHEEGLALLNAAGLTVHVAADPGLMTLAPHLADARAVITRNAGFSAAMLTAAPRLEVIGSHGAGVDAIDLSAAEARGIIVVNTPGANAQSVAELAFALVFACAKMIVPADRAVRADDFSFRYRQTSFELQGRTLGLVGFGAIGRRMAGMAKAFGMRVAVCSQHASAEDLAECGAESLSLDALCAQADIVSLHGLPRDAARFDAARFTRMKPGAVFINTARGALVEEAALAQALVDGRLAAAGIDVFATEPLDRQNPLLAAPNLVMTPHVGGSTEEALARTAREVAGDIVRVLRGESPRNPVTSGPAK